MKTITVRKTRKRERSGQFDLFVAYIGRGCRYYGTTEYEAVTLLARAELDAHEVVQIDAEITKLKHQRINLEQH